MTASLSSFCERTRRRRCLRHPDIPACSIWKTRSSGRTCPTTTPSLLSDSERAIRGEVFGSRVGAVTSAASRDRYEAVFRARHGIRGHAPTVGRVALFRVRCGNETTLRFRGDPARFRFVPTGRLGSETPRSVLRADAAGVVVVPRLAFRVGDGTPHLTFFVVLPAPFEHTVVIESIPKMPRVSRASAVGRLVGKAPVSSRDPLLPPAGFVFANERAWILRGFIANPLTLALYDMITALETPDARIVAPHGALLPAHTRHPVPPSILPSLIVVNIVPVVWLGVRAGVLIQRTRVAGAATLVLLLKPLGFASHATLEVCLIDR